MSDYGEEQPLRCEIVDGRLLISVGVNTIRDGLQVGWEYFGHANKAFIIISNASGFAEDIQRALKREDEQGASLLSELFDAAADLAINNGSEWITER